jgi:hypothetical protein
MALNLDDIAVIFISLTVLGLLISHDWRLSVIALSVMYLGVFVLVSISWPVEMAVVKLVSGWISASVLGIGIVNLANNRPRQTRYHPSEVVFQFSAAGLIALAAISITPNMQDWLPEATYEQILGGLLLIGMGVLHLGFTTQPLQTIFGLLTFIAGFETLYATIESSVLVAGFLAVINLGISLVGAYLILAPTLEANE